MSGMVSCVKTVEDMCNINSKKEFYVCQAEFFAGPDIEKCFDDKEKAEEFSNRFHVGIKTYVVDNNIDDEYMFSVLFNDSIYYNKPWFNDDKTSRVMYINERSASVVVSCHDVDSIVEIGRKMLIDFIKVHKGISYNVAYNYDNGEVYKEYDDKKLITESEVGKIVEYLEEEKHDFFYDADKEPIECDVEEIEMN